MNSLQLSNIITKDMHMDRLQLSKSDFRLLLITTALLPILCFISGFYAATSFNDIDKEKIVSMPLMLQETASKSELTNTLALSEQAKNTQVNVNEPASASTVTDTKIPSLTSGRYVVQAGIYSMYENARELQSELRVMGIDSQLTDDLKNDQHIYRIILGSFNSHNEAVRFLNSVKEEHNLDLFVAFPNSHDDLETVAML